MLKRTGVAKTTMASAKSWPTPTWRHRVRIFQGSLVLDSSFQREAIARLADDAEAIGTRQDQRDCDANAADGECGNGDHAG